MIQAAVEKMLFFVRRNPHYKLLLSLFLQPKIDLDFYEVHVVYQHTSQSQF